MAMLGRTLIISGGVLDVGFAKEYLKGQKFDTVVCADSGLDSAYGLGLPVHYAMCIPNLWHIRQKKMRQTHILF